MKTLQQKKVWKLIMKLLFIFVFWDFLLLSYVGLMLKVFKKKNNLIKNQSNQKIDYKI